MTTMILRLRERTWRRAEPRRRTARVIAPVRTRPHVLTRAELVECTCPDACERDHEND